MSELLFPKYGRVAIVDDKPTEIFIIQNALADYGIPYIYYDYDNMTKNPISSKAEGIRLLFLDINLDPGLETAEDKLRFAPLLYAVENIIPFENGPYFIILWTEDVSLKTRVCKFLLKNLNEEITTKPIAIDAMRKSEFKDKLLVEKKISNLLNKKKMFAFLTGVENQTMKVPANVLRLISYSFIKEYNNEEIEKMLVRFAMTEKGAFDSSLNATKTFLRQFSDLIRDRYMETIADEKSVKALSRYWTIDFADKEKLVKDIEKEKDVEQKAIINTVLNANFYADKKEKLPGKVYIRKGKKEKIKGEVLLKDTFGKDVKTLSDVVKKVHAHYDVYHVEIDITPSCDYAQGKNQMLRTAHGYIFIFEKILNDGSTPYWEQIDYSKIIAGYAKSSVFVTPTFYIKEKLCVLAFNTNLLDLEEIGFGDKLEYLCRLNDEITNEIRKIAGEHISRLGYNQIPFEIKADKK